MEKFKRYLVYFRNALAFSFAWLVLCVAIVSLFGGNSITAVFLMKLLALCVWGSAAFVFSFFTDFMKKKGFVSCLTVFFILFIPVEVLMFYLMGIFTGAGTLPLWIALAVIVGVSYISCILIDLFIMKKRAGVYTKKLMEYKEKKAA